MAAIDLSFGCTRALPEGVRAAWGARLIWPDQLLWDRQSLSASIPTEKSDLVAWLNGPGRGNGAISRALAAARSREVQDELGGATGDTVAVLYKDHRGTVAGSAQGSHGYLYVAGWLHEHVPRP